jgi:isocitrate dehydrogenase
MKKLSEKILDIKGRVVATVRFVLEGSEYKPLFFVKEDEVENLPDGSFEFVGDAIFSEEQKQIVEKEMKALEEDEKVKRYLLLEDMLMEYQFQEQVDRTY